MKILTLILCLVAATASAADVAFLSAPRTTGKFITQSLSENDGPYRTKLAQLIVRNEEGFEKVLTDNVLDFSVAWDAKSLLVTKLTGYSIRPDNVVVYGNARIKELEAELAKAKYVLDAVSASLKSIFDQLTE